MSNQNIVGVDIGGTKVCIGIINDGKILEKIQLATPAKEDKYVVINTIVGGISSLIKGKKVDGIGVGVPGLLNDKKGIVYDLNNIPSWQEVHLADAIRNQLKLEVYLTNDANSFALGERYYGKGKEYDNFVGITLGTGLGVGFIINGQIFSGLLSSAGELAVIPYLHHNFEYYCSSQFFLNEFGVSGAEVFERALDGDQMALGLFRQHGQHLGHLIKHLLHVMAPEAIFIGGSVREAFPFFEQSMWETLQAFPYKRVLNDLVIEKSEIDDVALLGAAALFEMRRNEHEENLLKSV